MLDSQGSGAAARPARALWAPLRQICPERLGFSCGDGCVCKQGCRSSLDVCVGGCACTLVCASVRVCEREDSDSEAEEEKKVIVGKNVREKIGQRERERAERERERARDR